MHARGRLVCFMCRYVHARSYSTPLGHECRVPSWAAEAGYASRSDYVGVRNFSCMDCSYNRSAFTRFTRGVGNRSQRCIFRDRPPNLSVYAQPVRWWLTEHVVLVYTVPVARSYTISVAVTSELSRAVCYRRHPAQFILPATKVSLYFVGRLIS